MAKANGSAVAEFSPLEEAAWFGLLGAHGRIARAVEGDLLERVGISHAEFVILLRLSGVKPARMRIQDLAADSALTRSGTSRAVARLEGMGLISRETAPEDRRGAYAALTATGRITLKTARNGHVALVRTQFLDLFSRKELKVMASFGKRVDVAAP